MSEGDRKRKLKKQIYGNNKRFKRNALVAGDVGFLVTCNNGNEGKAIREACDLLDEYAVDVDGGATTDSFKADKTELDKEGSDEDVESALKSECSRIKANTEKTTCRFVGVDSGVNNCCFIKSNLGDPPSTLAYAIMKDLFTKKVRKCRFIQRMLPVDATCKTFEKDFIEASRGLVTREFGTPKEGEEAATSYAVEFKARYNGTVRRETAYKVLGELIGEANPAVKVNLTNPSITVLVDVMGKVTCLSIVRGYQEFHRYNVHKACPEEEATVKEKSHSNEETTEEEKKQ